MNSSPGSATASTLFRKAMLLPAVTVMRETPSVCTPFSVASLVRIASSSGA